MSVHGIVVSLYVAPQAAAVMQSRDQVDAVAGRGLDGDRYFTGTGTYSRDPATGRHVTLVEIEAIEGLRRDYGIEIAPAQTRRNIITRDVALNHLVDREFFVSEVRLRGMRLCEPCAHLEQLTKRGVLRGLIHRGGLRAEILNGGTLRIGGPIATIEDRR
jgi:MOSC domain-containing protein YiiM